MIAFAALVLALQDETSLPKIAEIQSFSGQVEIVNPKGVSRKPAKFGTRLKNAEIRDEDRVKTGEGSQAVILFPDSTKFTLKEKGEIQILQKTLAKPTPEGNTVGRRIKLLVGDMVSEVIPNREIRTDFEMPAGSAAVRGTRLRIVAAGASSVVSVTDGVVRYLNTKYDTVLDLLDGQRVRFTEGSLTIDVLDDGGNDVIGQAGPRRLALNRNDRLKLDDAPGGARGTIDQGPINLDGVDTTNPFDFVPKGDAASQWPDVQPGGATGAPWPEGYQPPTDAFGAAPDASPGSPTAMDLLTELGTSYQSAGGSSTATSIYPLLIDDFNRAADPIIGNGWVEQGNWNIVGNTASVDIVQGWGTAFLEKDIGYQSTFRFEATFDYASNNVWAHLEVNGTSSPSTGPNVLYDGLAGGGMLKLYDGASFLNSTSGVGTSPIFAPFTLALECNGTTLTGEISGVGVGGSVSAPFTGG